MQQASKRISLTMLVNGRFKCKLHGIFKRHNYLNETQAIPCLPTEVSIPAAKRSVFCIPLREVRRILSTWARFALSWGEKQHFLRMSRKPSTTYDFKDFKMHQKLSAIENHVSLSYEVVIKAQENIQCSAPIRETLRSDASLPSSTKKGHTTLINYGCVNNISLSKPSTPFIYYTKAYNIYPKTSCQQNPHFSTSSLATLLIESSSLNFVINHFISKISIVNTTPY